jgi:hypothetical protein
MCTEFWWENLIPSITWKTKADVEGYYLNTVVGNKCGKESWTPGEKRFMQGFIQRNENSASMFSIHIFPDAVCCK